MGAAGVEKEQAEQRQRGYDYSSNGAGEAG
jgi:hypothetical protein